MSQTPRYLFSGLASLWMDGFSVSLSQMIPHVYDRLLDGSGFEYLQVCAFGTPLLASIMVEKPWPQVSSEGVVEVYVDLRGCHRGYRHPVLPVCLADGFERVFVPLVFVR